MAEGNSEAGLGFSDLPLELREMIWEHTLPAPRLFHVMAAKQLGPDRPSRRRLAGEAALTARNLRVASRDEVDTYTGTLLFEHDFPPPVATRVCSESRGVALRRGKFLFPKARPNQGLGSKQLSHPGFWFNLEKDMLYLDRTLRHTFFIASTNDTPRPPFVIPGLELVRNVALEWRWFFSNGRRPLAEYSGPEMRASWLRIFSSLLSWFPSMKTVCYTLPQARFKGGYTFGREPWALKKRSASVVDLPHGVTIPIESGIRSWGDVREELVRTMECKELVEAVKGKCGGVTFPVGLEGIWLLREGVGGMNPSELERQFGSRGIRVFES